MPQNPAFDPDTWLQQQGSNLKVKPQTSPTLFDPDDWLSKQYATNKPPQQPKQQSWGEYATTIPSLKDWAAGRGNSLIQDIFDPAVLAGTGAAVATAPASPLASIPAAAAAYTGVRSAQRLARGEHTTPGQVAGDVITGGVGEAVGRGVPAAAKKVFGRAEMDPLGHVVNEYFSGDVSADQLTKSGKLNFMGNVARSGMTSRGKMEALGERQSRTAIETLESEAAKLSPTYRDTGNRGSIHDVGNAGRRLQGTLGKELSNLNAEAGKQYGDILAKMRQYNAAPTARKPAGAGFIPNQQAQAAPTGPTIEQLHKRRSASLKMAREAFEAGDTQMQQKHMANANRLMDRIEKNAPPDIFRKYKATSDWYNTEINRLNNETVFDIRQGTKGEKVMGKILNSELKAFTPRGENVSLDNPDLVQLLKAATPAKQWRETQGSLVHQLVTESIDPEDKLISGEKLAKKLSKMSEDSQKALFGPALPEIQRTIEVLRRAQSGKKGGPGHLAISVREPAAYMSGAGMVGSIVTGNPGPALAGGIGSAAIIASPPTFAALLTNPTGRKLLIRAAGSQGPARKTAIIALQRYLSQQAASGVENVGMHATINRSPEIPEPPQ